MPRLTVKAYIAALPAVIRQKAKDDAYRAYVTEALRLIGENTAKYAGGSYIKAHYTEIIEDCLPVKLDDALFDIPFHQA